MPSGHVKQIYMLYLRLHLAVVYSLQIFLAMHVRCRKVYSWQVILVQAIYYTKLQAYQAVFDPTFPELAIRAGKPSEDQSVMHEASGWELTKFDKLTCKDRHEVATATSPPVKNSPFRAGYGFIKDHVSELKWWKHSHRRKRFDTFLSRSPQHSNINI